MCWGMTLNFSHETQQQALGAMFNEQIKQIFAEVEKDASNGDFLRNLTLALSSSARNLGFIRITHINYLNFNGDRLNGRRQPPSQARTLSIAVGRPISEGILT
jgi:hypothetical protein